METNDTWDGDPGRFSIEQWRNSCVIDRGGDPSDKDNFALPVKDPDGRLNRSGLAAAAARLSQVKGISADQRATAARHLIELYGHVGLPAPDSLKEIAGGANRSVSYSTMERRSIPIAVTAEPGSRVLGGYAAKFNKSSRMIPTGRGGAFVEQVAPGFFDKSRDAGWPGMHGGGVVARFNHSDMHTLGNTRSGTLQLAVDGTGLEYRTDVPPSRQDVLDLAARGDLVHSSFSFANAADDWNFANGVAQRTLISGVLLDVAPVAGAVAAYPDTTCAIRSLAAAMHADFDDVIDLAAKDELRQLFTRSDRPTMSWHETNLITHGLRWPGSQECAEARQLLAERRAGR